MSTPATQRRGVAVALLVTLGGVAWLLNGLMATLVAAVVVVMVAWPVHARILARMPNRPAVATALTLSALVAGVLLPLGLAGWVVIGELVDLFDGAGITWQEVPGRLGAWLDSPGVRGTFQRLTGARIAPSRWVVEQLQAAVSPALQQAGATARDAVNNLGALVLRGFIMILVVATLFHAGPSLGARVMSLIPVEHAAQEQVWERLARFARGFVVAALAVAVAQGSLAIVGYAIAGIGRPLVWGVLTGVVSVVPFVGTSLVWVPLAAVQLARGEIVSAVILALWSVLVVGSVDNFVRPFVIGRSANIHPTLVFLAVIGGLTSLGLSGLLIGPLLMGVVLALLELYETRDARRDDAP